MADVEHLVALRAGPVDIGVGGQTPTREANGITCPTRGADAIGVH